MRALVLASSQNDTVADFVSILRLAESLLRLAHFWRRELAATSAWTSSLKRCIEYLKINKIEHLHSAIFTECSMVPFLCCAIFVNTVGLKYIK